MVYTNVLKYLLFAIKVLKMLMLYLSKDLPVFYVSNILINNALGCLVV